MWNGIAKIIYFILMMNLPEEITSPSEAKTAICNP